MDPDFLKEIVIEAANNACLINFQVFLKSSFKRFDIYKFVIRTSEKEISILFNGELVGMMDQISGTWHDHDLNDPNCFKKLAESIKKATDANKYKNY